MAVLNAGEIEKLNRSYPGFSAIKLGERLSLLDTDGSFTGALSDLTADELAAVQGAAAASAANVFATMADVVAGGALASGKLIVGDANGDPQPVTMSGDGTLSNVGVFAIAADSIINADIKTTAAIAVSKLEALGTGQFIAGNGGVPTVRTMGGDATLDANGNLIIAALAVENSMIATGLDPAKLTLASGSLIVGNGANAGAAVAMSGDGTLSNAGVFAIAGGVIINADVNAAAAIAWSKMAALTDGHLLVGSAGNVAVDVVVSGHVSLANTGAFTLKVHEITAAAAVPNVADLVAIADESAVGDTTLAFTVAELLTAAGDVTDIGAAVAADDRLLLTDESVAGDPARSLTVQVLLDAMNVLGDVAPVITAAATDKMPIVDATDGTAKTITLLELLTAAAGDGLDQNAVDGTLAVGVHNLATTVAAPSITAAAPDYVAISDESEAGDPTGKASLFAVLTAAAGSCLAQDAATGALGLADAVANRNPYLAVSSADNADGTATITIQAKDAGGTNLAANVLFRFWTGTANDLGEDAMTDLGVATGTLVRETVANTELLAVTEAVGGTATITVTHAAGTVYGWAEVGGLVFPVAIVITGP